VETKLCAYADDRDHPGREATSRLSPLIASGEITIADCTAAALASRPDKGREKWLDELCWHDWFEHVKASGLDAPRIEPEWDDSPELFERWCAGQTGFPVVDAGLRELATTRWMHNRARMVSASFLVKHLHIEGAPTATRSRSSTSLQRSPWPGSGTAPLPCDRPVQPIRRPIRGGGAKS